MPVAGLQNTQIVAAALNVVAGLGALLIARSPARVRSVKRRRAVFERPAGAADPPSTSPGPSTEVTLTIVALAMIGFAAMGMEIVWFRHLTILLGGFRAVFSLLLTVILVGIGGFVAVRRHRSPHRQAGTLADERAGTFRRIHASRTGDCGCERRRGDESSAAQAAPDGFARMLAEVWFNARPMLLEVALPALLMGFSFPLANAITQRAERLVGRRAGVLYLANTLGAVCGSLAAGFVFLPSLGIQGSVTLRRPWPVLRWCRSTWWREPAHGVLREWHSPAHCSSEAEHLRVAAPAPGLRHQARVAVTGCARAAREPA